MKTLLQENWEVVENGHVEPENTINWSNAQMIALQKVSTKDNVAFCTKLWMSLALRILQLQNLQKQHWTFQRRRIKEMSEASAASNSQG